MNWFAWVILGVILGPVIIMAFLVNTSWYRSKRPNIYKNERRYDIWDDLFP